MLDQPALLNQPLNNTTDDVVALNNGRDLDVGDILQIEDERMQINEVMSPNNYKVTRVPPLAAHAVNAAVYNLPNPTNQNQLNMPWIAPPGSDWLQVGGVWMKGLN